MDGLPRKMRLKWKPSECSIAKTLVTVVAGLDKNSGCTLFCPALLGHGIRRDGRANEDVSNQRWFSKSMKRSNIISRSNTNGLFL